jgi:predicted Holliday junction resolvase-like endonuclease
VLTWLLVAGALVLAALAALLAFERWKTRYTLVVRQDAIQRSQSVTTGKVFEQLVPYLPDFRFNPKDARFLGSPVDFVVFDGLSEGSVRRVVFVEVKTGLAGLSTRERRVRDAVQAGQVDWFELRLPSELPGPDAGQGGG